MQFLLTIVRHDDADEYEEFFRRYHADPIYSVAGEGTTHLKTLELLGISKSEKTLFIGVLTDENCHGVLRALTKEMKIDLPDRGVSLAVPLNSIGGKATLAYFTGDQPDTKKEDSQMIRSDHELIVAIYEKGYTDMVMDAAREAGARGGTTIRAKGTAGQAEKFFGVSLASEKEICFIVSDEEGKKPIMRSIMQKAGTETPAHAVTFSLPVSDTAGFRFSDTVQKED